MAIQKMRRILPCFGCGQRISKRVWESSYIIGCDSSRRLKSRDFLGFAELRLSAWKVALAEAGCVVVVSTSSVMIVSSVAA